jgi:hypothetical protein
LRRTYGKLVSHILAIRYRDILHAVFYLLRSGCSDACRHVTTLSSANQVRNMGPASLLRSQAPAKLWLFWLASLSEAALTGIVYRCFSDEQSDCLVEFSVLHAMFPSLAFEPARIGAQRQSGIRKGRFTVKQRDWRHHGKTKEKTARTLGPGL